MILIAVSGADHTGKTTFVRSLRQRLQAARSDVEVVEMWLRWNPRARLGGSRRTQPVSTVDPLHRGSLPKRLLGGTPLRTLYLRAYAQLYSYQLRLQLGAVAGKTDILIADRYTLDFWADQIGSGAARPTDMRVDWLRAPRADLQFVLKADDDVLRARIDPAEDIEALLRHATVYRQLLKQDERAIELDTLRPGSFEEAVRRVMAKMGPGEIG